MLLTLFLACFFSFGRCAVFLPECFEYRRDYRITSSGFVGDYDIRLEINTLTMMTGGLIANCSELRFRQQRTGLWLDYWFESKCNDIRTRVWVTPAFDDGNEVVEMYYGCRTATGAPILPPDGYGDEELWSGSWYVLGDDNGCGTWSTADDSFFDGRYIQVVHAPNKVQNDGSVSGHTHTTSATWPVASTTCTADIGGDAFSVALHGAGHNLASATIAAAASNEDDPLFKKLQFCKKTGSYSLNLETNHIILLTTNYSTMTCLEKYNSMLNYHLMGSNLSQALDTGGTSEHKHHLSSTIAVASQTESVLDGNDGQMADATHTHPNDPDEDLDVLSNRPQYTDAVYARVTCVGHDYELNMAFFVDGGLPPKGFRYTPNYNGSYLWGASTHSNINQPALSHTHSTSGNLDSGQASGSANQCNSTGTNYTMAAGNHHHVTSFVTDDAPSLDDLYRVEIPLVQYKENFEMTVIQNINTHHFACNNTWHGDPGVCNSRGTCNGTDIICECTPTWTGQWCQDKVKCGGYEFDNHLRCYMRGDCYRDAGDDNATCHCHGTYFGDDCEIHTCYLIRFDNTSVCGGQLWTPATVRTGVCWDVDSCMCFQKFYGRQCQEYFPNGTVYLGGLTTDPAYSFFIPYYAPTHYIPATEMPFETEFNCSERFFFFESTLIVGIDSVCAWIVLDGEPGVSVTISKYAPIVTMKEAELEITLLNSITNLFGARVDVVNDIQNDTSLGDRGKTFFTPEVTAIFISVFVMIAVMAAIVVVVVVVVCACSGSRRGTGKTTDVSSVEVEVDEVTKVEVDEVTKVEEKMVVPAVVKESKEREQSDGADSSSSSSSHTTSSSSSSSSEESDDE